MKNKTSMKGKVFLINCGTYPFDVLVSVGQTDDEFRKSLPKYVPPCALKELEEDPDILKFENKTVQGRTIYFANGYLIIRLKHYPKTTSHQSHLAHEVFHAVEFLFIHINMPLTKASSEAYAYLIGYLTKQIYEKL